MSLFGGNGRGPRERTEEERLRALEERERRRLAAAGQPAAPSAAGPVAASTPAPGTPPAPGPVAAPADADAEADAGWWDEDDLHSPVRAGSAPSTAAWPPPLFPAEPRPERTKSRGTRRPAAAKGDASAPAEDRPTERPRMPGDGPLKIEPEPPAQPLAPAYDLPDYRQVAVHRRRSLAGRASTRTVVSPPGDTNMGGTLSPRRSRRRRIVLLVLLALLVVVGVSQWMLWQPLKGEGATPVTVEIAEGSSARQVAEQLADAGVVDSASLFGLRALLAGKRDALTAGSLTLNKDMSYSAALAALSGAVPAAPKLDKAVIPEGLSIREVDARFRRQNVLKDYAATTRTVLAAQRTTLRSRYGLPARTKTLEGLLFPASYELPVGFTANDVIDRQLQAFKQNIAGISMTRTKQANLTPYEVVIIASLVEREARLTRERPLIAAVIYNRLKAGMPLGIDATFRYASGDWSSPIKQSELDRDGPYNSRTRTGLPPTPIGNPGLASLQAAAAPAKVDYLYFVVKPNRCGEHAFAATAAKAALDTAKYNAARDAAGGKSPVTC